MLWQLVIGNNRCKDCVHNVKILLNSLNIGGLKMIKYNIERDMFEEIKF